MWVESWKLNESEKKKKELSEKKINESNKKILEHKKVKEKISVEIESDEKLDQLKNLVKKWLISKEDAKKVVDWEDIDEKNITEIFDKIEEIEEIKDINKYIPEDLRISKDDYIKALHDDIFRVQTITKLDSSLTLLANQITPDSAVWFSLFSWFLTVLDKNLIVVQENTIDIKDNLKEIDTKKGINNEQKSLWERFVKFLKEIFN